jgi:hypothetical protein
MTIQISVEASNLRLDALEPLFANGVLEIRSGAVPANNAAANTGTVLATITLPADPFGAASGRSKTFLGSWVDSSADNTGTAAHFRVFKTDGTTCHMQGTVTNTGGGGDMTVNNVSFASGQNFSITAFTMNDPNG